MSVFISHILKDSPSLGVIGQTSSQSDHWSTKVMNSRGKIMLSLNKAFLAAVLNTLKVGLLPDRTFFAYFRDGPILVFSNTLTAITLMDLARD